MQAVSTIYSCSDINNDVSNMGMTDLRRVTRPALGLNNRKPSELPGIRSRLFGEGRQGKATGLSGKVGIAKIAGVDFIRKTAMGYQGRRDMRLKSKAHLKHSHIDRPSPPPAA
jgi:hypothetical protein